MTISQNAEANHFLWLIELEVDFLNCKFTLKYSKDSRTAFAIVAPSPTCLGFIKSPGSPASLSWLVASRDLRPCYRRRTIYSRCYHSPQVGFLGRSPVVSGMIPSEPVTDGGGVEQERNQALSLARWVSGTSTATVESAVFAKFQDWASSAQRTQIEYRAAQRWPNFGLQRFIFSQLNLVINIGYDINTLY